MRRRVNFRLWLIFSWLVFSAPKQTRRFGRGWRVYCNPRLAKTTTEAGCFLLPILLPIKAYLASFGFKPLQ